MVRNSKETISKFILILELRIFALKRIDLYEKSLMTGDCHVRFCERGEVKYLPLTRQFTVNSKLENHAIHKITIFTFMKKDIQKNQNNPIDNKKEIIFSARKSVAINFNNELITAYWNVGKIIIENEKVNNINNSSSKQFTDEIGKGFSRSNLFNMRKLYLEYPDVQTLSGQLTWSQA